MSKSGMSSFGTIFQIDSTQIAEVYSINGPNMTKDVQETSDLSSTGYRSFKATLKDPGEISLGLRYIPSGLTHHGQATSLTFASGMGLLGAYNLSAGTAALSCTLIWADPVSTSMVFSGIVTGFEMSADIDSPLDAQCTIKLTGAPKLT